MSNEAKEYVQQWCGDAFPYFPEKFSAHEVFTLMERYAQDRTPPDPDAHIEDQEQYLEAKSKRFEARTEGESTAEVERAMKGEASVSVDRIMEGFDASVEAATEAGVDDEEQDWIDIEQVRKEFTTRITSLFNGEG